MSVDDVLRQERILDALERIAAALEKDPVRITYPTLVIPTTEQPWTGDPVPYEVIVTCGSQEGDNG